MSCKDNETAFVELGSEPVADGVLYYVTPEGAVTSTGDQWVGAFKKGKENKLVVYFYGGGVSVDAFTAAHGLSKTPGEMFYFDDMSIWKQVAYNCYSSAFGSQSDENPFKDWSVMVLPYTTGDFHIGQGEFPYTGVDGQEHTLYHHGYTNFKLYMDKVMPYVGTPEAIVVSGSSAGGFGTSFLSEDITELFPETTNFVCCVDASQLYWDQFPEVCRNVWNAPEHIASRFVSDNPVYDCLVTLHNDKPYVKILFVCSSRDHALVAYQNYFDNGVMSVGTKENGDIFQQKLGNFLQNLLAVDDNAGAFIWNDIVKDEATGLTEHTIETGPNFHTDRSGNGSVSRWIADAVEGNVRVIGLELLQ